MRNNKIRYATLLISSILMFAFYQNCETAKMEIAEKATFSGSEVSSGITDTFACTADEEMIAGRCISTLSACGDKAHMSRWFEVGSGEVEVKRYCESTMDFVNDIHEELVEFECRDGSIRELGNTKTGARLRAETCPDTKRSCGDKKDGDLWWLETEESLYKKIECREGDDIQNQYSKMLEYRCDDGDVVATGKSEFGTLIKKETCLEDMRACGTRSHNSIFYANNGSVTKPRKCESGETVKDFYHLQEQFKCYDGNITATGEIRESSEPYRRTVCPKVVTNCGSRIDGEVWFEESSETIEEKVSCSFGTKTRSYYKEYEYKCSVGKTDKTGNHRIGRLHKLGVCPEAECDGYQEGEIYLKDISEFISKNVACEDSDAYEVRSYKVETEFKCTMGKPAKTGEYKFPEDYIVRRACPVVVKCGVDQYKVAGKCVAVPVGHYSTAGSNDKVACTNKPASSTYTSSGNGANQCAFSCDSGYSKDSKDGKFCEKQVCQPGARLSCDIENGFAEKYCSSNGLKIGSDCKVRSCAIDHYQVGDACLTVGVGNYSPKDSMIKSSCTKKPANSKYNSMGNGKDACSWTCSAGYAKNGNSCEKQSCTPGTRVSCSIGNGSGDKLCSKDGLSYGSCEVKTCGTDYYKVGNKCVAVGTGYYSTSTSSSRVSCTNKPATSKYTSSGKGRNACAYSCNAGYAKDGNSCKKQICSPGKRTSCSIGNGSGDKLCSTNGLSYGSCEVKTCGTDYYKVGNKCVAVGTGYYSTSTSSSRVSCTNKPAKSNYISSGKGKNACDYNCFSGYSKDGNSCKKQICNPSAVSKCSVTNGEGVKACAANGLSYGSCVINSCGVDYYKVGNSCVSVGVGYYSFAGTAARVSCTNKPADATYTSSGNGANSCNWNCSSGKVKSGNSCKARYTWVNVAYEGEAQSRTCSRIGAGTARPSTGHCASGERVATSGDGYQSIYYRRGTRGRNGAGTIVSSKYCYGNGQKRDKDKTDRTMAWLCDRGANSGGTSGGGTTGGGGGGISRDNIGNIKEF